MIYFDGDFTSELLKELEKAEYKVDVCMYVWRFYQNDPTLEVQKVYTALLRLATKGVKVRILTDFPEAAARMRQDGLNAFAVPATRIMHTKMFIIDEDCVTIGSHNMTKRSTVKNLEATAILHDFESIDAAQRYFEIIWRTYAESKTNLAQPTGAI